jgi:hypothetical protein
MDADMVEELTSQCFTVFGPIVIVGDMPDVFLEEQRLH